MGTQSFHSVPYCSEKWNAEGLLQIEPILSKQWDDEDCDTKVERYVMVLVRFRLKRQMENMLTERLLSHLNTKQHLVRNRSVPV